MEDWKSPLTAKMPENPIYRVIHCLMLRLLVQFLRLAGWGAVVGVPAMILGPQRCTRLVKKYPIAIGTACIAMLICVALWSDSLHSKPTEFEIESIDHYDDPVELLAETTSFETLGSLAESGFLPEVAAATVPAENSNETSQSPESAEAVVTTVASFGPDMQEINSGSSAPNRVVWLTGDIEDYSTSLPVTPVRNAVRTPTSRQ